MKIIYESDVLRLEFKNAMEQYLEYFWILPFANGNFPFIFELSDHDDRIGSIIIGISNFVTAPTVITEFFVHPNVKYIEDESIIGAHKFFLFYNSDRDWKCFFGSINMDRNSFLQEPMCVYLLTAHDDTNSELIQQYFRIANFLQTRSKKLSEEEFEIYWEKWKLIQSAKITESN